MAENANHGWAGRVQEVQALLRRFKLARTQLERSASGRGASDQRAELQREVRTLHKVLARTARGLIADVSRLSPRRIRFDADQKEAGSLRTHENESKGRLEWSMVFGPSAVSRSGKAKTLGIVDGLRRRLDGERQSFKARRGVPGSAEFAEALARRWARIPNLERLDEWSEEFLARFDRSLAWFGDHLAGRFEPQPLGGSPDMVFEEAVQVGGQLRGGDRGLPEAAIGSGPRNYLPAAAAATSGGITAAPGIAASPGFPLAPPPSSAPSVGAAAPRAWPLLPFSGPPAVTADGSTSLGRSVVAPSPVRHVPGFHVAPSPPSPAARGFAPQWLTKTPAHRDWTRPTGQEPSAWTQRASGPTLRYPTTGGRQSVTRFAAPTPTSLMRTVPARPLAERLGGAPFLPPAARAAGIPVSARRPQHSVATHLSSPGWSVGADAVPLPPADSGYGRRVVRGRGFAPATQQGARGARPREQEHHESHAMAQPSAPLGPRGASTVSPEGARVAPQGEPIVPFVAAAQGGSATTGFPGESSRRRPGLPFLFAPPGLLAAASDLARSSDRAGDPPGLDRPTVPFLTDTRSSRFPGRPLMRPLVAALSGEPPSARTGRRLPRGGIWAPRLDETIPSQAIAGRLRPSADLSGFHTPAVSRGLQVTPELNAPPRTQRGMRLGMPQVTHGAGGFDQSPAGALGLPATVPLAPGSLRAPHFSPLVHPMLTTARSAAPSQILPGPILPSGTGNGDDRSILRLPKSLAAPRLPSPNWTLGGLGASQVPARLARPLSRGSSVAGHRWLPEQAVARTGSIVEREWPPKSLGGLRLPSPNWTLGGLGAPQVPARLAQPLSRGSSVAGRRGLPEQAVGRTGSIVGREWQAPGAGVHLASRDSEHTLTPETTAATRGSGRSVIRDQPGRVVGDNATGTGSVGARPLGATPHATSTMAPARLSTWPNEAETAPSLVPRRGSAGGIGGRPNLELPWVAPSPMTGVPMMPSPMSPPVGRMVPANVWGPDHRIGAGLMPLAARHVPRLLRGMLPMTIGGAHRTPGATFPPASWLRFSTDRRELVPAGAEQWNARSPGSAFGVGHGDWPGRPEMSYVMLPSRGRVAASTRRPELRIVTEAGSASPSTTQDPKKDKGGEGRILKASVGRDHRPLSSNAADGDRVVDGARQSGVSALDVDRLAAQVYGRIKQRLAVDRERRGFVR